MAASSRIPKIKHEIVHADKLAIFSCNDEIGEIDIRHYFIKNWKTLTIGLDNSTILFIAGIHGDESGKLDENEDIQQLKNQVRKSKKMIFSVFSPLFNHYFYSLPKEF